MNALALAPAAGGEVRLALEAMATRFELVLHGPDASALRAAGEEALGEVARLERQLSFYRPDSDVTWINRHAAEGPVPVEPSLFALLARCRTLSELTDGAFDITVGPLMRAWGFARGYTELPCAADVEAARAAVGSRHLLLDHQAGTVTFARPGMSVDLGAAGKGYAVDAAIAVLREHGVASALIHGGTSSVHVIGTDMSGTPWRIGWPSAADRLRLFDLQDRALAVSAVSGRSFLCGGREYGHVMDPRTGMAIAGARTATVAGPASLECDALSTALLVLGPGWLPALTARFPDYEGAAA